MQSKYILNICNLLAKNDQLSKQNMNLYSKSFNFSYKFFNMELDFKLKNEQNNAFS